MGYLLVVRGKFYNELLRWCNIQLLRYSQVDDIKYVALFARLDGLAYFEVVLEYIPLHGLDNLDTFKVDDVYVISKVLA